MLFMYLTIQGEDKVLTYTMDPKSGKLEPHASLSVPGKPGPMTTDWQMKFAFVGRRGTNQISSYAIDQKSAALSLASTVNLPTDMCFLYVDKTNRFLLSTYFAQGKIAVHAIDNGVLRDPPIEWISSKRGSHSIQTDASNRFAFVPHIASPPPSNFILQYRFDQNTGHLTPNSPEKVVPSELIGPRHCCFHPKLDFVYFSNEQGACVTAYRFDEKKGTLTRDHEVSSLPPDYKGDNMCAEIRIRPQANCLYVSNRIHDSIGCISVDQKGRLTPMAWAPTEKTPRAFSLDPSGNFLYVAGQDSGKLASYKVDDKTGRLEPLATYTVGPRPLWVQIVELGK